jgi:outer membrane lipoprotein-sorting protein
VKPFALLALTLLSLQEKNEAEELFKRMEEKLVKAKTLQCKFTISMNRGELTFKGDYSADAENRIRIEAEATVRSLGLKEKGLTVSDGKQVASSGQDPGSWLRFAAPASYGQSIRIGIARHGFMDANINAGSELDSKADAEKRFTASRFRMGKGEKINGRDAQQVLYRMGRGSWQDDAALIWIDKETLLPLKRSYQNEHTRIDETYSGFKLDEKIDPARFELPKEAK